MGYVVSPPSSADWDGVLDDDAGAGALLASGEEALAVAVRSPRAERSIAAMNSSAGAGAAGASPRMISLASTPGRW